MKKNVLNRSEEIFVVKKLKVLFRGHMLLVILTVQKLLKRFHEKKFKKKKQTEFRDEKLIERKDDKLCTR